MLANLKNSLAFAFISVLSGLTPSLSFAENIQASSCQIFIKQIAAVPNSHGSESMAAIVKVNFLGNDEYIQRVAFYGKLSAQDLGNSSECHNTPDSRVSNQFTITNASAPTPYDQLAYGEYMFYFPIRTGSVVSMCMGYEYSTIGSFLVETNKNTYWINPNLDANQYFYFDRNGYQRLPAGIRSSTLRPDLRYFNPAGCQ